MNKYTVCIQAAGVGSRLTTGKDLHKALVPIKQKSILTRIIELYPSNTEFIVLIGYKKKQIISFIAARFPKLNVKYVTINKYIGKGSGPGFSLLKAKNLLQKPFIFVACDTLVEEKPPLPKFNWIGISGTATSKHYLVSELHKDRVVNYYDKQTEDFILRKSKYYSSLKKLNFNTFIGLAGIHDYQTFWVGLEHNKKLHSNELQVVNGLEQLIINGHETYAIKFKWMDTGSDENYSKTRAYYNDNFLLKPNEFFYREKNKIIKIYTEKDKAKKIFKRSKNLKNIVPKVRQYGENLIMYNYQKGQLISDTNDDKIFENFLNFMQDKLWSKKMRFKNNLLKKKSYQFYKDKTFERIKMYLSNNKTVDEVKWINNTNVESVYKLLNKIDWNYLADGDFAEFHGDPQPENIIVKNPFKFTLIDWRDDFAQNLLYGDVYYDIAKIDHALTISQKIIRENKYHVSYEKEYAKYKFTKRKNLSSYKKVLKKFITDNEYISFKVNLLTPLIYLNIAALHHHPYSDLLFFHGKLSLSKILSE